MKLRKIVMVYSQTETVIKKLKTKTKTKDKKT